MLISDKSIHLGPISNMDLLKSKHGNVIIPIVKRGVKLYVHP